MDSRAGPGEGRHAADSRGVSGRVGKDVPRPAEELPAQALGNPLQRHQAELPQADLRRRCCGGDLPSRVPEDAAHVASSEPAEVRRVSMPPLGVPEGPTKYEVTDEGVVPRVWNRDVQPRVWCGKCSETR